MNLYEAALGERNCIYYFTKFERYDQKGSGLRASWNWSAFFLAVSGRSIKRCTGGSSLT